MEFCRMKRNTWHCSKQAISWDGDLLTSTRRLTEKDVKVIASHLAGSWKILGVRLNFPPEVLERIAAASIDEKEMAEKMLRTWSKLSTATVGRLAITLWGMGLHAIALELPP